MKSYTDLEQSKKLAEILPLESADMYFEPSVGFCTEPSEARVGDIKYAHPRSIPCWSLAALLDVLPKSGKYEPFIDIRYNRIEYHAVDDEIADKDYLLCYTDGRSLLDACYEMIIKLHELKML